MVVEYKLSETVKNVQHKICYHCVVMMKSKTDGRKQCNVIVRDKFIFEDSRSSTSRLMLRNLNLRCKVIPKSNVG